MTRQEITLVVEQGLGVRSPGLFMPFPNPNRHPCQHPKYTGMERATGDYTLML